MELLQSKTIQKFLWDLIGYEQTKIFKKVQETL